MTFPFKRQIRDFAHHNLTWTAMFLCLLNKQLTSYVQLLIANNNFIYTCSENILKKKNQLILELLSCKDGEVVKNRNYEFS